MHDFICKECGKQFKSYHKTAKYCSVECNLKNNSVAPKLKDISNKRYGKLVAIERAYIKNNRSYWLCRCDCGNTKIVFIDYLTNGTCKSCGCLLAETGTEKIKNNLKIKEFREKNFVDGTNLAVLNTKKYKNNSSGKKGVCWNKRANSWEVSICFQKKKHYLGLYKNLEDAIKARKEAEEKYFKPILDKNKNKEAD